MHLGVTLLRAALSMYTVSYRVFNSFCCLFEGSAIELMAREGIMVEAEESPTDFCFSAEKKVESTPGIGNMKFVGFRTEIQPGVTGAKEVTSMGEKFLDPPNPSFVTSVYTRMIPFSSSDTIKPPLPSL